MLDIHTHRFYENPSVSILNCFPDDFTPFPDRYYSVGFHPWYLTADNKEDWNKFEEQVSNPQVLAVGEAGLDKLSDVSIPIQEAAFRKQAEIASKLNKPLIIHCVKAFNEIIQYKMQWKPDVAWIIHGFRGKKQLAEQLLEHGFYLSFGEKYQEDALKATPIDRLFIETDESTTDIHLLYEKAASALSIPIPEFMNHIQTNIREVFFNS